MVTSNRLQGNLLKHCEDYYKDTGVFHREQKWGLTFHKTPDISPYTMGSPVVTELLLFFPQEFYLLKDLFWFDGLTNDHVFLFFLLNRPPVWTRCSFSMVLCASEGDSIPSPGAESEVNRGSSISLVVDRLSNGQVLGSLEQSLRQGCLHK